MFICFPFAFIRSISVGTKDKGGILFSLPSCVLLLFMIKPNVNQWNQGQGIEFMTHFKLQ